MQQAAHPAAKAPDPIDRHVGARLRRRRVAIGLSQEKLGEALGVTFQQVQKYEKGANRIGASRLQQTAQVLGVPVTYFFEGDAAAEGFAEEASPYGAAEGDADARRLLAAFARIEDPTLRERVLALVEAMVPATGPVG